MRWVWVVNGTRSIGSALYFPQTFLSFSCVKFHLNLSLLNHHISQQLLQKLALFLKILNFKFRFLDIPIQVAFILIFNARPIVLDTFVPPLLNLIKPTHTQLPNSSNRFVLILAIDHHVFLVLLMGFVVLGSGIKGGRQTASQRIHTLLFY